MPRVPLKPLLLRAYRAGVLAVIMWLIHSQHRWIGAQRGHPLTAESVRDFFPQAAALGPRDPDSGAQRVLDAQQETIGLVTQTAPLSDSLIGYCGPTNTLVACDVQGRIIGLRVLHSDDTIEHLQEVIRQRAFFDAFKGIKLGDADAKVKIDAVSGATLTSTSIAEGVLRRIGRHAPALRFPDEITLDEVREFVPQAASLGPSTAKAGVLDVFDEKKKLLAHVCRTSPVSDSVIGYKGPSDTLVILDAAGEKITAVKLRKSFDTKDYVGYVTGDSTFLKTFAGMEVSKLADLDFNAAKIEGVSGATETSWSVAEGLKRRAKTLAESSQKPSLLGGMHFNLGLCVMIAWSCVIAFTRLRGVGWLRVVHQLALIGYVGFTLGGMLSQGMLVGWARHGAPWMHSAELVLLATAAFLLPLFTRHQFYCHHFCPHGALQQLLSHRLKWQLHVPAKLSRALEKLPVILLAVVVGIAMTGWNFNLNSLEPFDAYLVRVAGWSAIVIAIAGAVASLFVPMAYCRYGCPTGALLKFVRYTGAADHFGKRDALALAFVVLAAGVGHAARV